MSIMKDDSCLSEERVGKQGKWVVFYSLMQKKKMKEDLNSNSSNQ